MSSFGEFFQDADDRDEAIQQNFELAFFKEVGKLLSAREGRTIRIQSFDDLYAEQFPLQVALHKMSWINSDEMFKLLVKPSSSRIFREFLSVSVDYDELVRQKRFGLVFQVPGWSKFVVLHTRYVGQQFTDAALVSKFRGQHLIIESLQSLMSTEFT